MKLSQPTLDAATEANSVLSVENISAAYGEIVALNDVSFDILPGEFVGLLGANGAGKSTTLRTIAGLLHPRSGYIRHRGKNIIGKKPHDLLRMGISLVPEGRQVFPYSSVLENLELGAITRSSKPEVKASLEEVYALFPVLADRRLQYAGSLSGGEQQMLAIGRALMSKPEILLLDEPSMGLAPKIIEQIFELIAGLNKSGVTILVVEQNATISLEVVDRAYVLEQGRTVLSGSASELANNSDVAQAYLGL